PRPRLRDRHRPDPAARPGPAGQRHLPAGALRGRRRPRRPRRGARGGQGGLRPARRHPRTSCRGSGGPGPRNRDGKHWQGAELMPRPGFVLEVDRSTPPILFHHGESFRLEKLPAGRSRVLYPAEPLEPLEDVDASIRHALDNPIGDSEPLRALLRPGMKLTIAFDDISLPLPPMRRPDVRQRIIEAVLDQAAAAGVDDVHLIAALALHRRMTEAELRHAVGDRVYDAFAPHGLLYNHDAEDPDNLAFLGTTPHGEEVEINKRAAESDLLVYVNINLVSMDGGHKSTATGLASYRSLRHHHNVRTMRHSTSFMDRHASELHSSNWRMGKVIRDAGVRIFQIETTLNNDTFGTSGPLSVLQKREWEWTARDRAAFLAMKAGLDRLPLPA